MKAVVIDTNVIAAANEEAEHAGPPCVLSCIEALEAARQAVVVIDDGSLCFDEYFRHADRSGQPRVGDAFARWLWENQHGRHCERVTITPKAVGSEDFVEFPRDRELQDFHRKDRKFVAIALKSKRKPTILNATDSGWWRFRIALGKIGIRLKHLCPELLHLAAPKPDSSCRPG